MVTELKHTIVVYRRMDKIDKKQRRKESSRGVMMIPIERFVSILKS